jgi:hypothetical protein
MFDYYDCLKDILYRLTYVGGASQNNKQLFRATCAIGWMEYCITSDKYL